MDPPELHSDAGALLGTWTLVSDRQGTPLGALDSLGAQIAAAAAVSHNPFGAVEGLAPAGSEAPVSGYTGAAQGVSNGGGMVYLRNRWYDPQSGRFLTQDPIGLAGGVNLYAYAGNDPISFSDPFGLKGCSWLGKYDQACDYNGDGKNSGSEVAAYKSIHSTSKLSKLGWDAVGVLNTVVESKRGNASLAVIGGMAASELSSPDFVVPSNGKAIPIPDGARGPTPTEKPGVQYTGGSGGKGMDARTTGVRIMEPNSNQGTRVNYMNATGQTVDPATGKTISNADPRGHLTVEP